MEEVGGGDEVVEVPRLGRGVSLEEFESLCKALTRLQDLGADPVHQFDLKQVIIWNDGMKKARLRDNKEARSRNLCFILLTLTWTSHEGGLSILAPLRLKPGQGPRARPMVTVALPPGAMEGGELQVLAGMPLERLREWQLEMHATYWARHLLGLHLGQDPYSSG